MSFSRIKLLFLIFILLFSAGRAVHASQLYYFFLQDHTSDTLTLKSDVLGVIKYISCSITTFSCADLGAATPASEESLFPEKEYYFNAAKNYAFVTEGSGHSLYTVNGSSTTLYDSLAINEPLYRVIFSSDQTKLIYFSSGVSPHLFVYDIVSKKIIFQREFQASVFSRLTLSPSGRYLAYYQSSKTTTGNNRHFKLLDLEKNTLYQIEDAVAYWDLLTEELTLYSFSPDEKNLIYLSDRDGYSTLYEVSLSNLSGTTLASTRLIVKPYDVADFTFVAPNTILFSANRESAHAWGLYRYDLLQGIVEKIADNISYGARMINFPYGVLFYKMSGPASFPALYDTGTGFVRNFSMPETVTAPPLSNDTLTAPISIGVTSAVLWQPKNSDPKKSHPVLIWLHGGPHRQAALGYHPYSSYASYDWILHQAVLSGATVIKLDYHGSYGYSRAFAESVKDNVGKIEMADVFAAQAYAKVHFPSSKVYLMGNSYGGYLALRSIVGDPALFSGALSINGVTDWGALLTYFQNSIFNTLFGGLPSYKNKARLDQASLTSRIHRLTDQKIILAQASADNTVPPIQASNLYNIVKGQGKDVTLLIYPGEDHVFDKSESIEGICKALFGLLNFSSDSACSYQ